MHLASEQARAPPSRGEVPIAAIVVLEERIVKRRGQIARLPIAIRRPRGNPCAPAAASAIGNYRLTAPLST